MVCEFCDEAVGASFPAILLLITATAATFATCGIAASPADATDETPQVMVTPAIDGGQGPSSQWPGSHAADQNDAPGNYPFFGMWSWFTPPGNTRP